MIDKINELIDLNLDLICKTKTNEIFSNKFQDLNGRELTQKFKGEKFADEMESRGLIRRKNELCIVEEYGYEIFKNGGCKKHIESKKEIELIEAEKAIFKENLELKLKLLQKDNLEHEKTIRAQNDRIRNLEEQIKFISLIKLYWWLIPLCVGIGIFINKLYQSIMQ